MQPLVVNIAVQREVQRLRVRVDPDPVLEYEHGQVVERDVPVFSETRIHGKHQGLATRDQ